MARCTILVDTGFVGEGRVILRDTRYVLPGVRSSNSELCGISGLGEVCALVSAVLLTCVAAC